MSLHQLSPLQIIQMDLDKQLVDNLKKVSKPQSQVGHIDVGSVNYAQELLKYADSFNGTPIQRLEKVNALKQDILKGYALFSIFATLKMSASESLLLSKQIHHILTFAKLNAQPFTESSALILLLKLYKSHPMLGFSLLEKYSKNDSDEWELPICFTTCPSTLSARFYYYGSWYLGTVGRISLSLKWIQESMRLVPIPVAESDKPKIDTVDNAKDTKAVKSNDKVEKVDDKKTEASDKKVEKKEDKMDIDVVKKPSIFKINKELHTKGRNGFLLACTKLLIACHLLMGDIPDKHLFKAVHQESHPLYYYKEICKSVKFGDMQSYLNTVKAQSQLFESDNTFGFMLRLKPAVRKSAIKSIMNVYSCISLKDMAIMMSQMSSTKTDEMVVDVSEHELEYMVGKCIEEGIVTGCVDHTHGVVYSGMKIAVPDLEPGQPRGLQSDAQTSSAFSSSLFDPTISFQKTVDQYHDRIHYCHQIHNAAVQAMRYKEEKKSLKEMEEAREQERELFQEIEDGDLDDDMMDF